MSSTRRRFLEQSASLAAAGGVMAFGATQTSGGDAVTPVSADQSYTVHPIGYVQKEKDGPARIVLFEQYAKGLLGLAGWSHLNVFWWFDKNDTPQKRGILQVHPRGNKKNPLTGVFATRSPVRPNLIALTVCKIVSVEGHTVTVDNIDAFDGTPVLDLKPVIPPDAPKGGVGVPNWARGGPKKE